MQTTVKSDEQKSNSVPAGAGPLLQNWEEHFRDDYTVVMLPGETTENASISIHNEDRRIARLIAAAPDLLAACKAFIERFDSGQGLRADTDHVSGLMRSAISKAEA